MDIILYIGYLVTAFLFILGVKRLGSPATARQGNLLSAFGMVIGVVVTLAQQNILGYTDILIGLVIGTCIGIVSARMVAMTAMLQPLND